MKKLKTDTVLSQTDGCSISIKELRDMLKNYDDDDILLLEDSTSNDIYYVDSVVVGEVGCFEENDEVVRQTLTMKLSV